MKCFMSMLVHFKIECGDDFKYPLAITTAEEVIRSFKASCF